LLEADAGDNPAALFDKWFKEAVSAMGFDANAMVLSTVGPAQRPASRVVLLKGYEDNLPVFYTNYHSQKAREMEANPQVSLLFFWHTLERQIRIEGTVKKTSRTASEAYFATRPLESQIGAIASEQSRPIPDRAFLEARAKEAAQKFGSSVPCPENWGGYILTPDYFEFWQGRPARLHDRITFRRAGSRWIRERLSP